MKAFMICIFLLATSLLSACASAPADATTDKSKPENQTVDEDSRPYRHIHEFHHGRDLW